MKRLIALLLCLLLLCGCGPAPSSPLFWQASDADGNVLYLLGSIHMADESLYPLPRVITDAFDEADALAVEMDILSLTQDLNAQMAMLDAMAYHDGSTIRDHVDEKLYNDMVELLSENGLYMPMLDGYTPAYWMSLLESVSTRASGLDEQSGVDMRLLSRAHEEGKPVYEVEGFERQLDTLLCIPDELQLFLLQSSVTGGELSALQLKQLYALYRAGDEEGLTEMVYAEDTSAFALLENGELLQQQYEEYTNAMYHERNAFMADAAEEYLKSGETVLMTVGAAHMLGETGIVAELARRGYTVTKLSPAK